MSKVLMYVKFDEKTGKVLGISPIKNSENSIAVPLADVTDILEGKESKKNYKVEYNPKSKQLELVYKLTTSFDGSNINDFIFEIPRTYIADPDILVEYNLPLNHWKIQIGEVLKQNLQDHAATLNQEIIISITKKHDPNVLYKTMSVSLPELLDNKSLIMPFSADFEFDDKPVSLFTVRKFYSYFFKRITNNEP